MREFSVPAAVTVADTATLTDPVWDNAAAAPDAVQFQRRVGAVWQDVTCAEFLDQVVALARGLLAAGIEPGERVALMSRTRYEWTLIDYAIWTCGAVTVPVYETSSAEQVAWILEDSGAVACFIETDAHREILAEARDRAPALAHVWQIESVRSALDELVADGAAVPREDVDRRRTGTKADDLATIIYTSGTTGRPKGCMITHRNMLSDIVNAVPELRSLFNEGARTLLFLPLAHSFARLIQIGAVQARATMGHTADTKNLAEVLKSFQPTFLLSVPRVFEKVYNTAKQRAHADGKGAIFDRAERVAIAYSQAERPGLALKVQHALFDRLVYSKLRAALGGRCERVISGGAPLGERLAHFFRGIGVTIYEGYGLTETSPATNANRDTGVRIGTVGRPLPGVTIRIADDGETLVRGDIVFKGYWNDPDATAEAIDDDGWFHTGDLGELDEDGYLRITGRKKEIIVTAGGKNVAPAVLEDRVRAHPLVSQCVVIGDRRPFIAALVTIDPDALPAWNKANGRPDGATAADLADDEQLRTEVQQAIDDANRAVSKAEAIKVFRILPRDFTEATGELTPSLKVKRNVVTKEYADEIAAIYER
ncbi:long-chain fatty acid--CoA ligase [Dactylosporangium roseum]|uniref:Acyl-CoA synthetase n=1 Tax=Dactylosporangium roseum TaxID=47989 RepID=A0ABY5YZW6_9ACTN|nr:long-chain fatty acid--CoA ligase [Dactylosporangium roseum]UWZ35306.1 long-chain fatty acid--CoA ligase [Dactylosporangium roseum]